MGRLLTKVGNIIDTAVLVSYSPTARIFVLLTLAYVGLAMSMPLKPLGEALRIIQMSLAGAVVYAYWRNAAACFLTPRWPQSQDLIALGIVVSWFSIFVNGAWAIMWRLSGQPAWMINNDLYNSWVALNSIAATIHIIAPNLVKEGIPRQDRVRLGTAWVVSACMITAVMWAKPDLSDYTVMLRPLLDESMSYRDYYERADPGD